MTEKKALPKWITHEEAFEIEGSPSVRQFAAWAARWNRRTDTINKIMRRRGKVELNSLLKALEEDAHNFDDLGEAYRKWNQRFWTGTRMRRRHF